MSENKNIYNKKSEKNDAYEDTEILYDIDGFDKCGFNKNKYNNRGIHQTEIFNKITKTLNLYIEELKYISSLLVLSNEKKSYDELKTLFLRTLVCVSNKPKLYFNENLSSQDDALNQYIEKYIYYKINDLENHIDNRQAIEVRRKMWLLRSKQKQKYISLYGFILPEYDNEIHNPSIVFTDGGEYVYLFGQEGGYPDSTDIGDSSCISTFQYEGNCYE